MAALIDLDALIDFRLRGMNPDAPDVRGTAQNPDVYFQGREASNPYYSAVPGIVQATMDALAERTGRSYSLVEYHGAPDAERVIVIMGSGVGAAPRSGRRPGPEGERVGLVTVRLYRPFPAQQFVSALPPSVRSIAVLDRTKEPGAIGEPLYLDVRAALDEAMDDARAAFGQSPAVIGGRYGLSSKEFTPAMAKAVLDELSAERPKRHFTVGIFDDVTSLSLAWDRDFRPPRAAGEVQAVFFGLGSDGTVGANKNSVKIIVDNDGRLRTGLLRVRLQEVGRHDGLAPAVRASAHKFDLPGQRRRLRGLPPLRPAQPRRRARTWPRTAPPSCSTALTGPTRSGTNFPATYAASCRTSTSISGSSTATASPRSAARQPHQHGDADLLLRPVQGDGARASDRSDQGRGQQGLRQAWPHHCGA